MNLFPDNGLSLLCGNRIMNCRPYIVPVDLTPKMIMPFFAVMVLIIGEFNQPIIDELVCNQPEVNVFVLNSHKKCSRSYLRYLGV